MEKIIISEREFYVLELIAKGYCDKEIAESLNISLATEKTYLHNLYQKSLISEGRQWQSAMRVKLVLKYLNNEYKVKLYYGKNRKVNNGRKCNQ